MSDGDETTQEPRTKPRKKRQVKSQAPPPEVTHEAIKELSRPHPGDPPLDQMSDDQFVRHTDRVYMLSQTIGMGIEDGKAQRTKELKELEDQADAEDRKAELAQSIFGCRPAWSRVLNRREQERTDCSGLWLAMLSM